MKTRNIIIIVLAAAILAGAFLWLKPKTENQSKEPETNLSEQKEQATPKPQEFQITIKENKIVSGNSVIRVKRDQEVKLKVTSDVAEELHLHGYDKTLDLEPNVQSELKFMADISGRFPLELHNAEVEIGALEVAPE